MATTAKQLPGFPYTAGANLVAVAASGCAGLAGLRWLLLGSAPRLVVRQGLEALLSEPRALGACHLRQARFRLTPDAKLAGYYHIDVRTRSSPELSGRAIAVLWKAKWVGKSRETSDATPLEEEAVCRGLAPPFRRLDIQLPDWGLHVQVWPLDFSFPQLVRVSDPEYVCRLLARTSARCAVTPVRYQPGQRHVLRYDFVDGTKRTPQSTVFAKLYRNGDSDRFSKVTKGVADFLAGKEMGVTCLQPIQCFSKEDVVFFPSLCGESLSEQLRRGTPKTGHWLKSAGRAISALHGASLHGSFGHLSLRGFEDEIGEVWDKSHYLSRLVPALASKVEAILSRAKELYQRFAQEPPAFTHGDLKTEHFWVTEDGLTMMDFDACGLGDPALDLGQFLADLHYWLDTHGQAAIEQAQENFLAGCTPPAPRSRLLRARLFEALELVRIAGRRIPLFDNNWRERVEGLVHCAAALLDNLDGRNRWSTLL